MATVIGMIRIKKAINLIYSISSNPERQKYPKTRTY